LGQTINQNDKFDYIYIGIGIGIMIGYFLGLVVKDWYFQYIL